MAAAKKISAFEAAEAVNSIMRLDSADQGPLLEVLTSYFLTPIRQNDHSDSEDSDLSDLEINDQEDAPTMEHSPMNESTKKKQQQQ